MTPKTKFILDFLPLAVFFLAYKTAGIMAATAAIMAATLLSIGITYTYEKKLAVTPLITGVMVTVFGGMTLYLNDPVFIKIKPTIVNLIFAAVLLVGCLMNKGLLHYILSPAFQLTAEGWKKLSRNWGAFFLFLAALNEYIWRNFSEEFWVNFKVFGMLTCTFVFTLSQVPLIKRHMEKASDERTDRL